MNLSWPEDDGMWKSCAALLPGLSGIGEGYVLIAGGYGLYLKQMWLRSNPETPTLVPLESWKDASPRSTKDIDLAIGLDLIADRETQERVIAILDQNEFKAKTKYWAWEKHASGGHNILVELHAPSPKAGSVNPYIEGGRVKRRSSSIEGAPTEEKKIHAKHNRELIGYELHPFHFELNGLRLSIPNPVTFAVMKATAAHELWEKSQTPSEKAVDSREKAQKHAQDLFRVLGMVTREESDRADDIVAAIEEARAYRNAANIVKASFVEPGHWGTAVAREQWRDEDLGRMQDTLRRWFT
jgi:hypothetical protein